MTDRITLTLSGEAYTSEQFDRIYDAHAEQLGHRPAFTVTRGDGHMTVLTTTADRDSAQAIINELEQAAGQTAAQIDVRGWRTWPTDRLFAALDQVDDSTELWDKMSDELAERQHEHETRINNGGVLP